MFDDTEETFLSEARDQSIRWARQLLADRNFFILDTETTGLDGVDEVIELAIVDPDGKVLLNQRVNPTISISAGAEAVHHISKAMLADKPTFKQIAESFLAVIAGKKIVTYNAAFDWRLIRQSCRAHNIDTPHREDTVWECAMNNYAAYYGDYNNYRGSFRWQKLTGGDHSALGDCLATLGLIKQMAESKLTVEK